MFTFYFEHWIICLIFYLFLHILHLGLFLRLWSGTNIDQNNGNGIVSLNCWSRHKYFYVMYWLMTVVSCLLVVCHAHLGWMKISNTLQFSHILIKLIYLEIDLSFFRWTKTKQRYPDQIDLDSDWLIHETAKLWYK